MAQRDSEGQRTEGQPTRGEDSLLGRRAAATRAEIVAAAVPLFLDRGFDDTSMAEVAEAAGMSRRTIYRYFATKDDIVFEAPRQWLEVFEDAVSTRGDGEPTRDLFRRGLVEVGRFVQQDAANVLAGFAILTSSPSLAARHGRSDAQWVSRYLELLLPDVAHRGDGLLVATTIATSLVGAQNGLMVVWAAGHEQGADAGEMMVAMLDQLDSVWPPECR